MVLLQVENISKSYGDLTLFSNVSFSLHKGDKLGLIARNGAGKTNLLNIVAGVDYPDEGKVTLRNGIVVNYLPQNPQIHYTTVFETLYQSDQTIVKLLTQYQDALTNQQHELLNELITQLDTLDAWNYETRILEFIERFHLPDANTEVKSLSGGLKKRLTLASVLLKKSDILILDEPTNHFDVQTTEWLEEYLNEKVETLLIVTHDRYFLENVCNEIIELDQKQLYFYEGNYSYFLKRRSERIQQMQSEIEKAQNLYRRELEWIRRMPKARTHKSKFRIQAFEDIKQKAFQQIDEQQVEIKTGSQRLGKKVLEIYNLEKSYNGHTYIRNFSYKFQPNERVGIVGPNGCGKTTLLQILAGKIKPDCGHYELGETVKLGYFTQSEISLPDEKKVIEVVKDIAEYIQTSDGNHLSASQLLTYFLFPPSMQYVYVNKLSGGEKRRLQLVTVLMTNPNLLFLDEPTNDLDILTLNVLENYLLNFNGTIVTVSHDRYFLDKICQHLFVFEKNGLIKDFPGNYTQYLQYAKTFQKQEIQPIQKKTESSVTTKEKRRSNKLSYKEQKELEQLEQVIDQLTKEKQEIESRLTTARLSSEELNQLSVTLHQINLSIEEKELRWIELMEKMESMEQ